MLRVAEHLPYRALLDHAALLQHYHALADIADHGHFMGNEDDGQAQALIDFAQQAEDRLSGFGVQRRGGFIAQQNRRIVNQSAGNAYALFLPARQLRRISRVLALQADQFQQLTHFLLALQLGYARHLERQFNVLPYGFGRHQVEVLEDHADLAPQRHQLVFVKTGDIHLINQHAAAAGLLKTVDGANQRRFAGAAAANNAENFAALDRQIDALEGVYRALATVIGFADADKTHMGVAQPGVQLGVVGAGLRLVEPLASNSHIHGQPPQPGWYRVP